MRGNPKSIYFITFNQRRIKQVVIISLKCNSKAFVRGTMVSESAVVSSSGSGRNKYVMKKAFL